MTGKRTIKLLFLCSLLFLAACSSSMLSKLPSSSFHEQLYVDARLYFSIKHPLDWKRLQVPVSSTNYHANTIRWQVNDLTQKNLGTGEMLIRSTATNPDKQLSDLLNEYLSTQPVLQTGDTEEVLLPAGKALKLSGHNEQQGRLTFALKGQNRDFIISLDYPSRRFDELIPIFAEIIDSFSEIGQQPTQ